jgi:UDP-2,3-diacylglucosamine pyrophosphatase LpxH
MRYRTLIVSDVHLSTVCFGARVPSRQPESQIDHVLASTIDRAVAQARAEGAHLELVLNGDVFDLDAAPAALADPREPDLHARREEAGAAEMMRRILADHPVAVAALGRCVSWGFPVIVLPGNHDSQLTFPGVRAELARALFERVNRRTFNVELLLVFRSWFHLTYTDALVEHGHQYDPLCRMYSLTARSGRLEDTVGAVATHRAASLFPSVDPYAVDPFVDADARALLSECLADVPRVVELAREVLIVEPSVTDGQYEAALGADTFTPLEARLRHQKLFAPKADASLLVRGACGGYDYGKDVDSRMRRAMLETAGLYGVGAVVMGHTHEPFLEREPNGTTIANSGSWAPRSDPDRPVGTFVSLVSDGDRFGAHLGRVGRDGRIG